MYARPDPTVGSKRHFIIMVITLLKWLVIARFLLKPHGVIVDVGERTKKAG